MGKLSTIQLQTILMNFFQNSDEKIIIFDRDSRVLSMNEAAKQLVSKKVYREMLDGKTKAICQICQGYTSKEAIRTCKSCYLFDNNEDKSSFQVFIDMGKRGIVPHTASLQTVDREQGIRLLTLRDVTDQMKTQEKLNQKLQMNRIIKAQEDERKRISRELHDSVAQEILSLLIEIRVMKYMTEDDEIIKKVRDTEEKLTNLLEDVQHMSSELRPSILDDLGLEAAFRAHFKLVEKNYGLIVHFHSNIGSKRFAGEIETNVYRICQEAVLNALKYAQVDEIHVHLLEEDYLTLIVKDEGVGFSIDKLEPQGTGLGLYGMQERAELINGKLTIDSTLDKGTKVCLKIPL